MKSLSKYILILLIVPFVFSSCDKDDDSDSQSPSEPTNFYEAHNGVWVTTFTDGSQTLIDIYDAGWDAYSRVTNSGCWSIPPSLGGSTTITSNTPDELVGETTGISASNVFSGDDLQVLLDNGYSTISISQAYLDNGPTLISFAQIFYAGTFEVELITVSGNFGKQSSDSFNVCKEVSNYNKYYNISEEALAKLKE